MPQQVICSVETCRHNYDRKCSLKNIVVGNDTFFGNDAKSKSETECSSFEA